MGQEGREGREKQQAAQRLRMVVGRAAQRLRVVVRNKQVANSMYNVPAATGTGSSGKGQFGGRPGWAF